VDLAAKLLAIIESETEPLSERARAGEELAALGDPRAKAIDRVVIQEGELLFRGRGEDADARRVHLSTYAIDRYPVTVAAFAEFIDAGGYTTRRFWSRRGWAWRSREAITRPRFWGEAEWAAYLIPNHPVVGVSAYEAEAYAAFRGVRLPTEAEWEKACRGPSGLCHPWGDEWREGCCGMRGVGPRGTLPIGSFPAGRSPYGLLDMVGCVWQWCADAADEHEHEHEHAEIADTDPFVDPEDYEEQAPRVTRGGAWNTLPWSLTCTSRNGYPPTARFSNLGFRCVSGNDLGGG
jgi:formylglycine-generating enzyme required for sulfatase activity